MPYSLIENFLNSGPEETGGRWAGQSTQQLANEMSKLTHNWTGRVLKTGKIPPSKAKDALDLTFPAGQESDDNEFQDIIQIQPLEFGLNLMSLEGVSDQTISSNTTLDGFNAYKNLTINSGVTVTLSGQPSLLLVTQTLENKGTITKSGNGSNGGSSGNNGGKGGDGGGGIYILAHNFINNSLTINGKNGTDGSSVNNGNDGNNGEDGKEITIDGTGYMGKAGDGGGVAGDYNPGNGGSVTTKDYSRNEITDHIFKVMTSQWINQQTSRNPTVNSPIDIKGPGGGEGCCNNLTDTKGCGGGGGGSAGQLALYCYKFDNTNIEALSGTGGNGYNHGNPGENGSGGNLIIGYHNKINEGTLTAGGTTLIDAS